jgi:hypothetical protein
MKGFEFGTEDDIERKLAQVLTSDSYARVVQAWKRGGEDQSRYSGGKLVANPSRAVLFRDNLSPVWLSAKRRLLGIHRRLLVPLLSGHSRLKISDENGDNIDPTSGFHPILSMYFLAREQLERERDDSKLFLKEG